jgi:hypothetical protein
MLLDRYKNGKGTNNAAEYATATGQNGCLVKGNERQPGRNECRPTKNESQPRRLAGKNERNECQLGKGSGQHERQHEIQPGFAGAVRS